LPLFIGTSGWQYRHWRGRFYPEKLAQRTWLEYYAARFDTVEVNNAFYRLPERSTFERWRATVPEGFVVAVKASRFLTHIRRLREPAEPVARLLERATALGEKLGPVLLQLPPDMKVELGRLDETLAQFPRSVRVVVEARHESWFTPEFAALLRERDAALCLADSPRRRTPLWRTASFGYVRFHEGRASPHPCYGRKALSSWAARIGELFSAEEDVFAYFNNDPLACALRDALRFAELAAAEGLVPTSVPGRSEVAVG
jgi:uncharacterized protein YecE (DUF72 family)